LSARNVAGVLAIVSFMSVVQLYAGQKDVPCTTAELIASEREASNLRSWDELYQSIKRYGRCNDVDADEGYSESAARILVDSWTTLPQLAELMSKDRKFGRTALYLINATIGSDDLNAIKKHATEKCPSKLKALCNKLVDRVDESVRENMLYNK
jgi:hypothetical protein